jgi:thymidylate synthase
MKQYLDCLKYVLENGIESEDRTGTGTISVFGYQTRYNLQDGFPAVTTKKLAWKAVTSELLWFLEGSTNERRLCEILHGTRDSSKRTIWSDNAENQGVSLGYINSELGPVYGAQWRSWKTYTVENYTDCIEHNDGSKTYIGAKTKVQYKDQIAQLVHDLKYNPDSRRHILNAWNVADLDKMALPPCHTTSQFYVRDGKLSCHLFQRSCDLFLGASFNIASYSLLTHMLAQVCDLKVGEFVHTISDAHIYKNHIEQVKEQLQREPYKAPTLVLDPSITDIDKFTMDSFTLVNYVHHSAIKAPMAI